MRLNILVFMILLILSSCYKEWLEVKPDQKMVVPTTLKDFQALLDNAVDLNSATTSTLGEVSSDNIVISDVDYSVSANVFHKNSYIWAKDIYEGGNDNRWNVHYKQVYIANVVLEGIGKYENKNNVSVLSQKLKGEALFFRAHALFQLSQLFSQPYDKANASEILGIPVPLSSDINSPTTRATNHVVYSRILDDLKESSALLSETPLVKTRPSKPASFGLLAKVLLVMKEYERAYKYADSCLQIKSTLIDYNSLDPAKPLPFEQFNEEVIFYTTMQIYSNGFLAEARISISNELYDSYLESDLRKKLFFNVINGRRVFKGSYDGSKSQYFSGIAIDEVLLIRAECSARMNIKDKAIADIHLLLSKRHKSGFNLDFLYAQPDIEKYIIEERRKELVMRGGRWSDLRRLNQEEKYQKTIIREVNGEIYTLLPNENKYVFPIPDIVIEMSGIQQNER